MRQIRSFVDDRFSAFCYACHGVPETRDHVPPKVFLDEPYPENLPVIGCCRSCNEDPSLDEEYTACLLEVAACRQDGSIERPKISRILAERPALAKRLAEATTADGHLTVEQDRVQRVIEKMGRGLWNYEVGETTGTLEATVGVAPISTLSENDLQRFLRVPTPKLLPEVGSRLMFKVLGALGAEQEPDPWQVVQSARFAYAIDTSSGARGRIKMILRDFLAAEVDLVRID